VPVFFLLRSLAEASVAAVAVRVTLAKNQKVAICLTAEQGAQWVRSRVIEYNRSSSTGNVLRIGQLVVRKANNNRELPVLVNSWLLIACLGPPRRADRTVGCVEGGGRV